MDLYFPLNFPVRLYQKAGPLHLRPAEIVSCTEFYFQVAKTCSHSMRVHVTRAAP